VRPGLMVILVSTPTVVLAAEETRRRIPEIPWWGHFIFWVGAIIIMTLVARVAFKEMLGARRTLKRLNREIGLVFVEFDFDHIKRWVALCLPHVWQGWGRGTMSGLADFATRELLAEQGARMAELAALGHVHETHFMRSLRVHPLGLFLDGSGPAPKDVCLFLRLEQKCIDFVHDGQERLVRGRRDIVQVHHFWLLKHNGHAWRLHRVWYADDDLSILTRHAPLPPLDQWQRPSIAVESD
jgi:hypothetical protein